MIPVLTRTMPCKKRTVQISNKQNSWVQIPNLKGRATYCIVPFLDYWREECEGSPTPTGSPSCCLMRSKDGKVPGPASTATKIAFTRKYRTYYQINSFKDDVLIGTVLHPNWATPHPNWATPHPKWASPHPRYNANIICVACYSRIPREIYRTVSDNLFAITISDPFACCRKLSDCGMHLDFTCIFADCFTFAYGTGT